MAFFRGGKVKQNSIMTSGINATRKATKPLLEAPGQFFTKKRF